MLSTAQRNTARPRYRALCAKRHKPSGSCCSWQVRTWRVASLGYATRSSVCERACARHTTGIVSVMYYTCVYVVVYMLFHPVRLCDTTTTHRRDERRRRRRTRFVGGGTSSSSSAAAPPPHNRHNGTVCVRTSHSVRFANSTVSVAYIQYAFFVCL